MAQAWPGPLPPTSSRSGGGRGGGDWQVLEVQEVDPGGAHPAPAVAVSRFVVVLLDLDLMVAYVHDVGDVPEGVLTLDAGRELRDRSHCRCVVHPDAHLARRPSPGLGVAPQGIAVVVGEVHAVVLVEPPGPEAGALPGEEVPGIDTVGLRRSVGVVVSAHGCELNRRIRPRCRMRLGRGAPPG